VTARTLHLVVPAYNPGAALGEFLPTLLSALRGAGKPHRVLVVDDGSAPDEAAAIQSLCEVLRHGYPTLLPPLVLPRNQGKGAAVYAGWGRAGAGELLGFIDADGSTGAPELVRLREAWEERRDPRTAVLASRKRIPGRTVDCHLHRHLPGRVFAAGVQALLRLGIHDTQCGCKLVPAEAYAAVKPQLVEAGFIFDVELLARLRHSGVKLLELPVDWSDLGRSTVRFTRDIPAMGFGLLRIRLRMAEQKKREGS
jgi:glycosyltransferase involved in cell wall biosynthesis